ncbi:hypothetical protein H0H87_003490, partial [Tephrocybe sp. NHM501043]
KYLGTSLHAAASGGSLEVVKQMLENGASFNAATKYIGTPLHAAASGGNLMVVKYLVEKGACVDTAASYVGTPLHAAVSGRNLEVVKYLFEKGASVDTASKNFRLMYVKNATADGAYQAKYLGTPLNTATQEGHLEMVEYLLEKGSSIDAASKARVCAMQGTAHGVCLGKYVGTPLHTASSGGNLKVVKHLLENGASVNATAKYVGTPLHAAATGGNLKVVKYLLEIGASVDAAAKYVGTPLHAAASGGNLKVVKHLLENGASMDAAGKDHSLKQAMTVIADGGCLAKYIGTPLHAAASSGHLKVVKHLLEKGASVDITGKNHILGHIKNTTADDTCLARYIGTPLHAAVSSGHLKVVKHLLEKGSSVDAIGKNFSLWLAKKTTSADCVFLAKYIGTPLFVAAQQGHLELVNYLVEKGASVDAAGENNLKQVKTFIAHGPC